MKKTMKAVRIYAPHDFRYEDVDIPEINENEVLLRIVATGICSGDIKNLHGGKRVWGDENGKPYIETPVIGGHEFFGEVVKVGNNVNGIKRNDLITSEQIVPCGKCRFCQEGNYQVCKRHYIYGYKYETQGSLAEYMKLPEYGLHHVLPSHMPLEQAVLIEPYACGMHAISKAKIQHNDVVIISGLGAIGLSMVCAAKLMQPKLLIGLDLRDNRMEKAMAFGADYVFNPQKHDIYKEISLLTERNGCDVYVEASGNGISVTQGLKLTRSMGRYIQFGVFADNVTADWNIIGDTKELHIIGAHLGAHCYKAVIDGIVSGFLKTDGVVTHIFKLNEWKQAYEIAEKDESAIKVVLVP